MSDSDSDYFDIGENDGTMVDDDIDDVEPAPGRLGKGRGKDIEWVEVARYTGKSTYENSAFFLDIKKNFTMRRGRETDFTCK